MTISMSPTGHHSPSRALVPHRFTGPGSLKGFCFAYTHRTAHFSVSQSGIVLSFLWSVVIFLAFLLTTSIINCHFLFFFFCRVNVSFSSPFVFFPLILSTVSFLLLHLANIYPLCPFTSSCSFILSPSLSYSLFSAICLLPYYH